MHPLQTNGQTDRRRAIDALHSIAVVRQKLRSPLFILETRDKNEKPLPHATYRSTQPDKTVSVLFLKSCLIARDRKLQFSDREDMGAQNPNLCPQISPNGDFSIFGPEFSVKKIFFRQVKIYGDRLPLTRRHKSHA